MLTSERVARDSSDARVVGGVGGAARDAWHLRLLATLRLPTSCDSMSARDPVRRDVSSSLSLPRRWRRPPPAAPDGPSRGGDRSNAGNGGRHRRSASSKASLGSEVQNGCEESGGDVTEMGHTTVDGKAKTAHNRDAKHVNNTGGATGSFTGRPVSSALSSTTANSSVSSSLSATPDSANASIGPEPSSPEVVLRRRPGRAGRARSGLGYVIGVMDPERMPTSQIDADGYVHLSASSSVQSAAPEAARRYPRTKRAAPVSMVTSGVAMPPPSPQQSPSSRRASLWGRLRRLGSPRMRQRHSCSAVVTPMASEALAAEFRQDLTTCASQEAVEALVADYLRRFSELSSGSSPPPLLPLSPALSWLELAADGSSRPGQQQRAANATAGDRADRTAQDGERTAPDGDRTAPDGGRAVHINRPGVAAALVHKRHVARSPDQLSLEVGDMVSVIDMGGAPDAAWWRGKRGLDVGLFPCECVQLISERAAGPGPGPGQQVGGGGGGGGGRSATLQPRSAGTLNRRQTGKLTAFFRSFMQPRPARRRLKLTETGGMFGGGAVFGAELTEHVLLSGTDVPVILTSCAEFIERHGIVDGIYRLSGVNSNIKRLRSSFDDRRIPDLCEPSIRQDIHSVSCLLKQYFRELPDPLLTYQLYDKFVAAVRSADDQRLVRMRDVVLQLPAPHYRSLEYLVRHLCRVSQHGHSTGMTAKNLAIVWAPNLARSRLLEAGGVMALQGVGVQAVIVEYLIRYSELVFSDKLAPLQPHTVIGPPGRMAGRRARPRSLAVCSPSRLVDADDDGRTRDSPATSPAKPPAAPPFLEVGGGPAALTNRYHTIIASLSPRKTGSLRFGRSPIAWRSLFRGRAGKNKGSSDPVDIALTNKTLTESDLSRSRITRRPLRSVRSAESLAPPVPPHASSVALDSCGDSVRTSPTRDESTYSANDSSTTSDCARTPAASESSFAVTEEPDASSGASSGASSADGERTPNGDDTTTRRVEELQSTPPHNTPVTAAVGKERPTPHPDLCRVASSCDVTSHDVTQLPTDSNTPLCRPPTEAEVFESPDNTERTERGTPGDDDATGLDLSEMGDEEASPEPSKLGGLVPEALEMLDQRLNAAGSVAAVNDDVQESRGPYENVTTTCPSGDDLDTTYATYETFEFPTTSPAEQPSGVDMRDATYADSETGGGGGSVATAHLRSEEYENTSFGSTVYENSTCAGLTDLPYENVGDPISYENVAHRRDQDRDWDYEDVDPAGIVDECVYEPVGVPASSPAPCSPGIDSNGPEYAPPEAGTLSGDEVYAQVKEFRRTLHEVNSIVQRDHTVLSETSDSSFDQGLKEAAATTAAIGERSMRSDAEHLRLSEAAEVQEAVESSAIAAGNDSNSEKLKVHMVLPSSETVCVLESAESLFSGSDSESSKLESESAQEDSDASDSEKSNGLAVTSNVTPEPSALTLETSVSLTTENATQLQSLSSLDTSAHLVEVNATVGSTEDEDRAKTEPNSLNLDEQGASTTNVLAAVESTEHLVQSNLASVTDISMLPQDYEQTTSADEDSHSGRLSMSSDILVTEVSMESSHNLTPAGNADERRDTSEQLIVIEESEAALRGTALPSFVAEEHEIDSKDCIIGATSGLVSNNSSSATVKLREQQHEHSGTVENESADDALTSSDTYTLRNDNEQSTPLETPPVSEIHDISVPRVTAACSSNSMNNDATPNARKSSVCETPVPGPTVCASGNSTWPRVPSGVSSEKNTLSGTAQRPLSASPQKSSTLVWRGSWSRRMSPAESEEPLWMRAEMRRPCERRASFKQLLSRFESFSSADISPLEASPEEEPGRRAAAPAPGAAQAHASAGGGRAWSTRSLPRPATRRDSAPACAARSLRGGASPPPVRRHRSQQHVGAEWRRPAAAGSPFLYHSRAAAQRLRPSGEAGVRCGRSSDGGGRETCATGLHRHQSCSAADRPADVDQSLSSESRPSERVTPSREEARPREPSVDSAASGGDSDSAQQSPTAESRQRIERYKEERRHLLREKYRADAFVRDPASRDRQWTRRPQRDDVHADSARTPPPPAGVKDAAATPASNGSSSEGRLPAAAAGSCQSGAIEPTETVVDCPSSAGSSELSCISVSPAVAARSDPLDDINVRERVASWGRVQHHSSALQQSCNASVLHSDVAIAEAAISESSGSTGRVAKPCVTERSCADTAAAGIRNMAARFEAAPAGTSGTGRSGV